MAEWSYIFLKSARRYLERLRLSDQERIVTALESLLMGPEQVDIKPLKGRPDWRLRVGDYRVLFLLDSKNKVYIITRIGPRGDIYKN